MDESYFKWKMPPALDLSLRNDIFGWDETYDASEIGLLLLEEDMVLGYSQTRGLYNKRERNGVIRRADGYV